MSAIKPEEIASGKSQTIARAALILTSFSNSRPHLTLGELAERLDLNPSTVYRYVATLQAAGLLERDERRGGYRLGLHTVELGGVALNQIEVRKQALEDMHWLHDETGLMVNLAVLFDGDVLHVAHAAPKGWPLWHTTPGRRAVAHCTALGKVLLAHAPWSKVRRTIERYGWRPYTPRSIRDFDRLRTELDRILEQGYGVDNEERSPGIRCLAVPIRDHTDRVVAALSVSGNVHGLTPEFSSQILPRLFEAGNRVSFRLGSPSAAAAL